MTLTRSDVEDLRARLAWPDASYQRLASQAGVDGPPDDYQQSLARRLAALRVEISDLETRRRAYGRQRANEWDEAIRLLSQATTAPHPAAHDPLVSQAQRSSPSPSRPYSGADAWVA